MWMPLFQTFQILKKFEKRKNDTLVYYVKKDKYFETNFARIKPFLLAKGRSKIGNILFEYKNDIIYSHTDSAIFSKKPENIKTGTKIGELRYEGFCEKFRCKNITEKSPNNNFEI